MTDERISVQKHAAKGAGLVLALAIPFIVAHEGRRNVGYADSIGVATDCVGHTGKDVQIGLRKSDAECDGELAQDLARTSNGIAPCIKVDVPTPSLAAFTSFAFNVGPGAFCRSSIVRKLNAHDLRGACLGLDAYVYAGGHRLQGLANRRRDERVLCLKGVK